AARSGRGWISASGVQKAAAEWFTVGGNTGVWPVLGAGSGFYIRAADYHRPGALGAVIGARIPGPDRTAETRAAAGAALSGARSGLGGHGAGSGSTGADDLRFVCVAH